MKRSRPSLRRDSFSSVTDPLTSRHGVGVRTITSRDVRGLADPGMVRLPRRPEHGETLGSVEGGLLLAVAFVVEFAAAARLARANPQQRIPYIGWPTNKPRWNGLLFAGGRPVRRGRRLVRVRAELQQRLAGGGPSGARLGACAACAPHGRSASLRTSRPRGRIYRCRHQRYPRARGLRPAQDFRPPKPPNCGPCRSRPRRAATGRHRTAW